MKNDPYDIRPGEDAVETPDRPDASLYFIGRISTPWARRDAWPKNGRGTDAECTIEVDPRWRVALTGIETCSHLIVLYWMDQARRDLVLQSPRHHSAPRGSFALRSPVRPNPIALSVVRLLRVDDTRLTVVGLDCRDGPPPTTVKTYF